MLRQIQLDTERVRRKISNSEPASGSSSSRSTCSQSSVTSTTSSNMADSLAAEQIQPRPATVMKRPTSQERTAYQTSGGDWVLGAKGWEPPPSQAKIAAQAEEEKTRKRLAEITATIAEQKRLQQERIDEALARENLESTDKSKYGDKFRRLVRSTSEMSVRSTVSQHSAAMDVIQSLATGSQHKNLSVHTQLSPIANSPSGSSGSNSSVVRKRKDLLHEVSLLSSGSEESDDESPKSIREHFPIF